MSLDTPLRRQHETELLSDYLARLGQLLEARGTGDAAPTAKEALSDYRAATAYVFCLAVNLGGSEGLVEGSARRRRLALLCGHVPTRQRDDRRCRHARLRLDSCPNRL